jgi:hypothetical protein
VNRDLRTLEPTFYRNFPSTSGSIAAAQEKTLNKVRLGSRYKRTFRKPMTPHDVLVDLTNLPDSTKGSFASAKGGRGGKDAAADIRRRLHSMRSSVLCGPMTV